MTPITKEMYNSCMLSDRKFVLFFHAAWCRPCLNLEPTIKKLDSELENIIFFDVDCDKDFGSELAGEFLVHSIPTIIFMSKGKMSSRLVGINSEDKIKAEIEKLS